MDLCKGATHAIEQKYNVPQNLLRAISLTESGRWLAEEKENIAWPWTVTSGGPGIYFQSKHEAIDYVRKLQSEGVRNIDVGCMQINLHYHPDAFETLHEAFDPYSNATYAADFLTRLFQETHSWTVAAGRYHSSEPTRHMRYREKVMAFWNHANEETHETVQQAHEERQPQLAVRKVDTQRMAALNSSFRERLDAQQKAMDRAEKMAQQISDWRDNRGLSNYGTVNAARNKALYKQKAKRGLMITNTQRRGLEPHDFSARRSAQLDKWRKTVADPELVQQQTGTPTLLD